MMKKTRGYYFLSLIYFTFAAQQCHSLPTTPEVALGTAEFKKIDSHVMEIRPSDQAIINYSQFDIGALEKVKFIQKSSSSCVLNRVQGKTPSEIFGSLESNGKVFLVNPNGIYFGPNSSVNIGSLIASTLDISDTDFVEGNYSFSSTNKSSKIRNEGKLVSIEGSIVLMAPQIQNLGSITARAGTVSLASGEHVILDFTGDGLIQFSVDGSLKEAIIEHLGDINASSVSLKMPVAKKAISEILNLDGIAEADVFIEENGVIQFASIASISAKKVLIEAANLEINGTVNAISFVEKGGEVHFFGKDISLKGAKLFTSGRSGGGEVLIGGEYQGGGTTPYASKVSMDEHSLILANAVENGDGGRVVLWSKDHTIFNGLIGAEGGRLSGDGGLIETSSQDVLDYRGEGHAGAPHGKDGTWLLDPNYLYIKEDSPAWAICYPDPSVYGGQDCYLCNSIDGEGCNFGENQVINCGSSDNQSLCRDFYQCKNFNGHNTTVILSASKAIYVQKTAEARSQSLTFQSCSDDSSNPIPVFLQANLESSGHTINFKSSVVPVIDVADFSINTTHQDHHDGGEVIMSNLQATDPSYGIFFFTVNGSSHTGSKVTVTTVTGSGSVKGENGTVNTFPPGNISATCSYLETSGMTTSSGGNIDITANSSQVSMVLLASNTVISTPSGKITVDRIDANSQAGQSLTMSAEGGSIDVEYIGTYTPLKDVSIEADKWTIKNITTYGGAVQMGASQLGDSFVVDTTDSGNNPSGANITIDSLEGGNYSINLNAGTQGSVFITSMASVGAVTVNGSSCSPNYISTRSGVININCPLLLKSASTLSTIASGSGANINIAGTVNGTSVSDGLRSFVAELGVGRLSVGTIGGAETPGSIKSVTISGSGDLDLPTIFVNTGSISILPPIKLSADRTLTLQTTATTSSSIISLGQVDNPFNLTINAAPASAALGLVGSITPLNQIIINGSAVNLNGNLTNNQSLSITNSATLTIAGALNVGGDFIQTGDGSVFLYDTINADSISIASEIYLIGTSFEMTSNVGSISCGLGITSAEGISGSAILHMDAASSLSIANELDQNKLILTCNLNAGTFLSIGGDINCDTINATASGGNVTFASSVEVETFTAASTTESVFIGNNLDCFSGLITAEGAVTIGGSLVGTYCDITATAGDVTIQNDTSLKQTFTVLASAGSVSMLNNLTAGDTTITATLGNVNIGDTLTAADLLITAGNGITVSGNLEIDSGDIIATGGNITFGQVLCNDAISVTVDSGSFTSQDLNSADCNLTIGGYITINGSLSTETLIVNDFNGALITGQTLNFGTSINGGSGDFVFQGPVTLGSLSTAASGYGVIINNGGVISSAVTFLNTEGVTLKSGTYGSMLFSGALQSTGSLTTILGGIGSKAGGITLEDVTFLSGASSIVANGFPVHIAGATSLQGNSTISSLSSDVHFTGAIEGPGALTIVTGEGEVTFDSSIGAETLLASLICTNIRHAHVKGTSVRADGWVNISADITISDTVSSIFSNFGLILGDINGITLGEQSITITAGIGDINLGKIGNLVPVGNVLIEADTVAHIQSITSRGTITITGDTVLASSSTLDTTAGPTWGYDVTLNSIEGTSSGVEGLTINAGSMGVVSLNADIGVSKPLSFLNITSFSTFFGSNLVTVLESQNYKSPVVMKKDCVFTTAGNITFESTLNSYADTSFLSFYMGNGASTFLEEVGGAYMGDLSVYNTSSLLLNEISAHSLRVSGGLPSVTLNETLNLFGPLGIFIDGGPINLGGEINAAHIFFRTSTTILNLDEPQPINIQGATPFSFQYINALGGNLGSPSSPLELNTTTQSTLGAKTRADLKGEPFHNFFFLDRQNPPCIITFNGVTLIDCNNVATSNQIIATVPKNLFYNTWAYSSWNNLSNDEFFFPPAVYPAENSIKERLYYIKSSKHSYNRQLKKRV